MKKLTIALAAILVAVGGAHAFQEQEELRGGGPYTPTKLEWLTVELNSGYRSDFEESGDVGQIERSFVHDQMDTIIVMIQYSGEVPRSHINRMADLGRKVARNSAKRRGWDWIKVEEQVEETK